MHILRIYHDGPRRRFVVYWVFRRLEIVEQLSRVLHHRRLMLQYNKYDDNLQNI